MKHKLKNFIGLFFGTLALLVLSTQTSLAFIPDSATLDPLYAEVTTDINTLNTKSWPIVFLVTGALIGIGLFKKFTNRAAS